MVAEGPGGPTGGATGGATGGTTGRHRVELPPQVTMGLLDYLTSHSLDADYAHAASRKRRAPDPDHRPRSGLAALAVLLLFGLLVATAGVQTARTATASQNGHEELVNQIHARNAAVSARRAHAAALRREVERLKDRQLRTTRQGRALSARLQRLGVMAGSVPVKGPGVRVVVDDAPNASSVQQKVLDTDLQKLVNSLWLAGAEAISINGQRLTALSPIRHAGSAITVNFTSLSRPYVVLAIGNPDQLPARFLETPGGSAWLDLQNAYGLKFDMTSEESLKVPADQNLTLHYATAAKGAR